ncbi:MAG: hypothetical protein OXU33_10010 [Gemmatimonadota bacterium]|nr:hypothetical protein [Gemmatimonadota bacterium]
MNHFDMPRLGRIPTLAVLLMLPSMAAGQSVGSVELMELTIADAHEAMLARTLARRSSSSWSHGAH